MHTRVRLNTRWWVVFTILMMMGTAWSLSTPLGAAPDEPAHLIKAAAVARGDFFGTPEPPTSLGDSAVVRVRVPKAFLETQLLAACYIFRNQVPASCAPKIVASKKIVEAETYVGRYPPLYYLVVGLPSLVYSSAGGIRLMRLVGLLFCCLFLASAFESAADSSRSSLAVAGVTLGVTPMVLFLGGVVNPSSLEIASALCLWVSGLVLVTEPHAATNGRVLARVGVSASVLVNVRGLSPLWLALIVLTLLAVARRELLVTIAKRKVSWMWASVVAVSSGFALWWIARDNPFAVLPRPTAPRGSYWNMLELGVGKLDSFLHEMVGIVGWLDTPAPAVTYYFWFGLVAVALLAGICLGARRRSITLCALILVTLASPVLIGAIRANRIGFIWQGRYSLPMAVGIPVFAAFCLQTERRWSSRIMRRSAVTFVVLVALAQAGMFVVALRRYTVGLAGPLNPFGGKWTPPLGAGGVTALFGVGLLAYTAYIYSRIRRAPALTDPRDDLPARAPRPGR